MYAHCLKRMIDFILSLLGVTILSPLLFVLTFLGAIKMKGNPFFTQPRPGKGEKIFRLIKFRTMTNEKDASGKLLPDEVRLNAYGRFLRSTSLDELPELFNILLGQMALVGPRPQLVRDMVFMSDEQRMRHTAKPGLSGLAQVMGRNSISWEDKINWDLKYIEKISFWGDVKIVWMTVMKVFIRKNNVDSEEVDLTPDYGDALLKAGKVDKDQYDVLQAKARIILEERV